MVADVADLEGQTAIVTGGGQGIGRSIALALAAAGADVALFDVEQIERREKANPMGRLGRPEDVAAAVLFFASRAAGYVTGQVLSVNGGVVRAG